MATAFLRGNVAHELTMLYERWMGIAGAFGAELALVDCASGKKWTFRELSRAAEEESLPQLDESVCFPQGTGPEFILSVLRAWRRGAVICPLEPGQEPIPFSSVPPGCAHLKTTSATTGTPRLIAFTAEQLAADADQIVGTMGLRPDWPNVAAISLAHSYGYSNLVLPLLLHGIPLVLASSALPEGLRQAARALPHITLAAVPALWRAWMEAKAVPANVRLAISAGAPLPLSTEQLVYDRWGLKIHNFYGASECGGIAFDTSTTPRIDSSCAGAPMLNVDVSTTPEECLAVRSPAVGWSYWPEPRPNLENGVYVTSDLAAIQNGVVYLRGRQSDQINVAGRKVSPETIERALALHPGVRACLVFGAPSRTSDRTEMIVACIVPDQEPSIESLRQHLLGKLPAWQVPRDWWFVPSLETNQRGKLPRGEWREKYLAR